MLERLRVKNYAIIEDIAVSLAPGLNALTGETGAGKSIIVGALSFVLGEKVSDEVVRLGEDACSVEAEFVLGEPALSRVKEILPDLECRGASVRIEREITRGGRSRASVNGRRVALADLREVGGLIVDFHGQHEHQRLLDARTHVDFLDAFAHLLPLRGRFEAALAGLRDMRKRIESLRHDIARIDQREDLIRFEVMEIERLGLKAGEDEEIEGEIALLENAEKILEAGTETMEVLYDGDGAAIQCLARAAALLSRLGAYSADLAALGENVRGAEVMIKETAETLRDCLGRIDLDALRLENLRERQAAIDRIKRKYGKNVTALLNHLKRLRQGLDNKEDLSNELAALEAAGRDRAGEVGGLAGELSRARKTAARGFEKAVERELKSLGMEGAGFRIVFEDVEDGEEVDDPEGNVHTVGLQGSDSVEFFVRTNKGEAMLPLRRIASGGEVSRVMLGLKRILADVDQVEVMVFDEIDSGIGGGMADVVGTKLREVSRARQVVCITHLAQIAAPADVHLAVGKATVGTRTATSVARVDGEARVLELARMLGGKKAPGSARLHAEEILKRAVSK
jgi:DNA repair protein RecN (Recombination protein N)